MFFVQIQILIKLNFTLVFCGFNGEESRGAISGNSEIPGSESDYSGFRIRLFCVPNRIIPGIVMQSGNSPKV